MLARLHTSRRLVGSGRCPLRNARRRTSVFSVVVIVIFVECEERRAIRSHNAARAVVAERAEWRRSARACRAAGEGGDEASGLVDARRSRHPRSLVLRAHRLVGAGGAPTRAALSTARRLGHRHALLREPLHRRGRAADAAARSALGVPAAASAPQPQLARVAMQRPLRLVLILRQQVESWQPKKQSNKPATSQRYVRHARSDEQRRPTLSQHRALHRRHRTHAPVGDIRGRTGRRRQYRLLHIAVVVLVCVVVLVAGV